MRYAVVVVWHDDDLANMVTGIPHRTEQAAETERLRIERLLSGGDPELGIAHIVTVLDHGEMRAVIKQQAQQT
jgi:hypothetical protein